MCFFGLKPVCLCGSTVKNILLVIEPNDASLVFRRIFGLWCFEMCFRSIMKWFCLNPIDCTCVCVTEIPDLREMKALIASFTWLQYFHCWFELIPHKEVAIQKWSLCLILSTDRQPRWVLDANSQFCWFYQVSCSSYLYHIKMTIKSPHNSLWNIWG